MEEYMTNNTYILISACALAMFFLSSCAETDVLRNSTRAEYDLSLEEWKNVQYFITSEVILKRKIQTRTQNVQRDVIVAEKTIDESEVTIPALTQCVAAEVGDRWLRIGFGKGDLFLDFRPTDSEPTTPYTLTTESGDMVQYQGDDYTIWYDSLPRLNYRFISEVKRKQESIVIQDVTPAEWQKLHSDSLTFQVTVKEGGEEASVDQGVAVAYQREGKKSKLSFKGIEGVAKALSGPFNAMEIRVAASDVLYVKVSSHLVLRMKVVEAGSKDAVLAVYKKK